MNEPNEHPYHAHHAPEQDPAMERLLDAMAGEDGACAGKGLEDRVLARVAGVWAPAPLAIVHRRTPFASRVRSSNALRAAAGVAIVCSAGAALLLLRQPGGATLPGEGVASITLVEQRIDALVALASADDAFGESLASIELWADVLGSDISADWVGSDLADMGLNGGAL